MLCVLINAGIAMASKAINLKTSQYYKYGIRKYWPVGGSKRDAMA